MDGPVISFDVSKGSSHMRAFISLDKPLGKVIVIKHDFDGYQQVRDLYQKLREKTGREPAVIYEYTGVYAFPLLTFFVSEGYTIYQIAPLESAKKRKSEIRSTKNDSMDTRTIASIYYGDRKKPLTPFKIQDQKYEDLKEMSRRYQFEVSMAITEKNRYHRCLDAVWPCFDEVIDYESDISLDVIIEFGHPANIKTAKGVLSAMKKNHPGRSGKREKTAERIVEYTKNHNSGVSMNSYMVRELQEFARRVKEGKRRINAVLDDLIALALTTDEFRLLQTIPSVNARSAVSIVAEIGDISRFSTAKGLIAFAGLDPTVNESGKKDSKHLQITKKGNKYLRTSLYLSVTNICHWHPESFISKFVDSKIKDGLPKKAAKVAGSAKLLRLIYSMFTNGTCYSEKE